MDLLENSDRFRSAQELHAALSEHGESSVLSTVYRALQQFVDSGDVHVFHAADGETLYRRCDRPDHHGHLICRRCGKTEELGADTVDDWRAAVSRTLGFNQISHVTEIVGTCTDCAA
ncbi:Fur family transcriptional regulator [Arthrobacter sp. TMS1-12-1]